MTSTVVCGYAGADWELNSSGQNACQVYAALAGQCNSAFVISSAASTDPPYMPQNNACTCNLVAYNLQAACGWCQSTIQSSWWLDESEWAGNCTSSTYNSAGIPSTVATSTINIPQWAFLSNTGTSWSPSRASSAAVSGSINIPTAIATGSANNGFSYSYNPYTYTGYSSNPYYWDAYYGTSVAVWAIAVGVIAGLYALMGIIMGVVYFIRQKRRKAWYGPMAQYYRQAGVGGYQGNYASGGQYQPPNFNRGSMHPGQQPYNPNTAGAPLLYNNEPNVHGSPPTTHSSLYTGTPVPAPTGYNAAYQPPPGTNPFNTPYPTPGEQPQYQPPPQNTNSMYGAPPSGAPPGAGGYKGHAEVY